MKPTTRTGGPGDSPPTGDDLIEVTLLIPVSGNDGQTFSPEHHAAFEAMLLARFGGLSRLPGTVTGQWASDGKVFTDHLIAYVVALPSITGGGLVGEVVSAAKTHYAQEAIYLRYLGISEIL